MDKVVVRLDTAKYQPPSQDDIDEGKAYVRKRNSVALALASLIDSLLMEASEKILRIGYQYNVDAEQFTLSSNAILFGQIQNIMDELEEEIAGLIETYSVSCAEDEPHRKMLAVYLSSLGRKNKGFADTLHEYLRRYLYDMEAMIASFRMAGHPLAESVTRMKTSLHQLYEQPEVKSAYRKPTVAAMYLQTKGVHFDFDTGKGTVGLANNGATNVTGMARNALAMVWMRYQGMMYEDEGADGYYQLRGSNYPCHLCDSQVGFHEGIEGIFDDPMPHVHCMCYRIPIYKMNNNGTDYNVT